MTLIVPPARPRDIREITRLRDIREITRLKARDADECK
jgi:hypothetical protein